MRTLRIGFSTPKKFKLPSFLIRTFEKTKFSHTFIVMEGRGNLPFDKVFQASHGDVNCLTYDNFKEDNKIFHEYTWDVPDKVYYGAATFLWNQLQKPYSIKQLLSIALNIKISNNNTEKYICTELAGIILRDHLGFDISKSLDYMGLRDIQHLLEEGKNEISSTHI